MNKTLRYAISLFRNDESIPHPFFLALEKPRKISKRFTRRERKEITAHYYRLKKVFGDMAFKEFHDELNREIIRELYCKAI